MERTQKGEISGRTLRRKPWVFEVLDSYRCFVTQADILTSASSTLLLWWLPSKVEHSPTLQLLPSKAFVTPANILTSTLSTLLLRLLPFKAEHSPTRCILSYYVLPLFYITSRLIIFSYSNFSKFNQVYKKRYS